MKILYTKTTEWRPHKFPAAEIYSKTVTYFLGIKIKTRLKKIA